jgi:hypothetical protein
MVVSRTVVVPALTTRVTLLLLAIVGAFGAALVMARAADSAGLPLLIVQAVFALAFLALAWIDLRIALALVVLELIVGGVSGRWTLLGGAISGRIVIDSILIAVAVLRIAQERLRTGRLTVGRYGLHALALAVLVPAIWMPLGLLNGNRPSDVMGDGNGFLFFAFALVLGAAALRGDLSWLRRWLLVCCVVDALLIVAIYFAAGNALVSVADLRQLLFRVFDVGGGVDTLANGTLRLYVGSGLYIQVGLILVTWELLRRPRQAWGWFALIALLAGLVATFTRGYWLGAIIGLAIVAVAAHVSRRNTLEYVGGLAAIVLIAGGVTSALGWPLLQTVGARAVSAFNGTPFLALEADGDQSNAIKLAQARVLLGHISERPLLGWGFGSIASDYPNGSTYSYELYYLDRAYKTGVVGLLLLLSFPARLLLDSWRQLRQSIPAPPGVSAREAAVPLAVLVSVLVAGATNPYLAGAAGVAALILPIAWLDPFPARVISYASESRAESVHRSKEHS